MIIQECTAANLGNSGMKSGYNVDSRGRSWGGCTEGSGLLEEGESIGAGNGSEAIYSLRKRGHSFELKEDANHRRNPKRPRWYNQTYVMFLALRLAEGPLPRAVLIPRALELSKILTRELGLPRLFGGKTPKNTASGLLTENRDKMFLSFIDEKTKKMYFTPSFDPGNFEQTLSRYNTWMSELAENVWPVQFGNVRQPSLEKAGVSDIPDTNKVVEAESGGAEETNKGGEETATEKEADNIFIPKTVEDIFEIKPSTIPNAGRGLFAKIYIPPRIILGYYFGVPYPEDEFDYLKGNCRHANEFAHKYRLTVLDATDENGMPFYNHPRIFCPFHFINESIGRQNLAFLEGLDVNQIFCVSTKPIYPGEETFVSYGPDVERSWLDENQANSDSSDPGKNASTETQSPPKSLYQYMLSLRGDVMFNNAKNLQTANGDLSSSQSAVSDE